MPSLGSKIVLVTGANGGLGTTVTEALLAEGATVVGVSRSIKQEDFSHPRFVAMSSDLSAAAAEALVGVITERFGKLDGVVHTVGGYAGAAVTATDEATWKKMFALNVDSAFFLFRAALPAMQKAGNGRIVAIGTRAAVEPAANLGAYAASKAALVHLVRTIAVENREHGITANIVLPGTMDTPANRKAMPEADPKDWIQPAHVASLIVWLLGDAGAPVSGTAIPLYGRDV
jgi:NAD(P)-dependent dehydrogenase (short-subunit alcohol dehydrogenase family)